MTAYGLVTGEGNTQVPLKNISVKASIQGVIANVQTDLLYKNEDKNPVEASFVFPIDDSSAVYKFEAVIEGRLIIGECQTKEEARQTYQDAVAAGETAFLMEEDDSKGDVFECKVGNLPAMTEAKVSFSYVTPCKVSEGEQGTTTFTYPCVLGPRYNITPPETTDNDGSQASTSANIAPKPKGKGRKEKVATYLAAKDLPYKFSAEILYYTKAPNVVQSVSCNAANRYTQMDQTRVKTRITDFPLDQDLEVEIHCSAQFKPMLYLEQGNSTKEGMLKSDLAVLQFHPKMTDYVKKASTRGEYIFVIDRSGSMHGDRIQNATKALGVCLDQLPQDCYFNILSFGSNYNTVFSSKNAKKSKLKGASILYSVAHKDLAKRHVAAMTADLGGTEMLKPFEWIYSQPTVPGYPRQVILLTDGSIWGDESQFFKMVKKESKTTRMFTFGIGFGASTSLVRGLARAGRGRCDFIKEDMHKMKRQVTYLLKCAMSPAVDDVKLEVKTPAGISYSMIPTELPPIFMGEHFIAHALLNGTVKKTSKKGSMLSAVLSGQVEGKEVAFTLESDLSNMEGETFEAEALPLHRLAAKAQIKELQDNENYNGHSKDKIELVSTAANIMSRYTSFVGVDKGRTEKVKGKQKHVDIPIAKVQPVMAPVAPALAAPMAGGAPRLYGGAGPNAPQALKYLCGKAPELPTDLLGNKEKPVAMITSSETSTDIKRPGNVETEVKTSNEEMEESLVVRKKRKLTDNKRLTMKKRKIYVKVLDARFAKWKDGYFYFATEVKSKQNNSRVRRAMRFKDGKVCSVHCKDILNGAALSPGDTVSVHCNKHTYSWAIILEYAADMDRFVLAYADGTVFNCRTEDIVVPIETAQKLQDRKGHMADPVRLVQFLGLDGLLREVTTSDLAELHTEGWINETLVAFWISKVLPLKTESDLLVKSHVVSPRFYLTLTNSLELDEDFLLLPADTQSTIIERRWRSFVLRTDRWRASKTEEADKLVLGVDLTQKQLIIFPMYDDLHWYVILVNITRDASDRTSFRAQFGTMDSYYKCLREHETDVLKRYLQGYFSRRGCVLSVDPGVYQYQVPIQGNEWDCGTCTLQCIHNIYQDGFKPKANLWWFDREDLVEQRKETARCILDEWEKQTELQ